MNLTIHVERQGDRWFPLGKVTDEKGKVVAYPRVWPDGYFEFAVTVPADEGSHAP